MKKVLFHLFCIVLSVLTAVHAGAADGGISGGGGNVICPRPPDGYQENPKHVDRVIVDSRSILRDYLYEKETRMKKGALPPREAQNFALLFQSQRHIQDAITKIQLQLEDDEPCFDRQGLPVDGSVRPLDRGRICVSSFNLAAKVHPNQIEAQATALLLHEYSEAVGVSEGKAVEIQKKALVDFGQY